MTHSLFGTDGIRALIGQHCFTDTGISTLGHALGQWITENYGACATVIIGHDTRNSADWIKHSLIATLTRHGHQLLDAQLITTPMLCWLVQDDPFIRCGIMISASHNPWDYNGIKLCDKKKGKIYPEDEARISFLYYHPTIPPFKSHLLGSSRNGTQEHEAYNNHLKRIFEPNFLHGLTIALDCAHGSASVIAPTLFRSFGATIISNGDQPNGTNINDNCGALHPASLAKLVIEQNAQVGFAFDGDADRVIAVAHDGTVRDGDDILALLTRHPRYQKEKTIVGTVMSNYGFESWLAQHNKTLIRTAVGDKYVAQALENNNLLLGGEQSGHIIMNDFLYTGDGIFTALRILETMLLTNNMNFSTFTKYPQVMINVPIQNKKSFAAYDLDAFVAPYHKELTKGRILVRISGTEPLIRVMVEDADLSCAQRVSSAIADACKKL